MVTRSVLCGAAVFGVVAAASGVAAGALAAGARPTGATGHAPASTEPAPTAQLSDSSGNTWADPTFLHSMVLSGAAALVLSVAGMVVVLRRRRYW